MGISGIGIDRIAIARIKLSSERFGEKFIRRVYTENEYQLALARGTYRRLAMYFAAKEAVAKAMGTGIRGFAMTDIEVSYSELGKPVVTLHRAAKEIAEQIGIRHIHLSLTDDEGTAMAFAIAEQ